MSLFWMRRLPEMSLENQSEAITELRLPRGGIIASWRLLVLNKALTSTRAVISEYKQLFGGVMHVYVHVRVLVLTEDQKTHSTIKMRTFLGVVFQGHSGWSSQRPMPV